MFQKEALGALAHTGAHLDLSAFSSWEVGIYFVLCWFTKDALEKSLFKNALKTTRQPTNNCGKWQNIINSELHITTDSASNCSVHPLNLLIKSYTKVIC